MLKLELNSVFLFHCGLESELERPCRSFVWSFVIFCKIIIGSICFLDAAGFDHSSNNLKRLYFFPLTRMIVLQKPQVLSFNLQLFPWCRFL